MNCQYCGSPIPEDASFCENCGAHVSRPEPSAEPAAPVNGNSLYSQPNQSAPYAPVNQYDPYTPARQPANPNAHQFPLKWPGSVGSFAVGAVIMVIVSFILFSSAFKSLGGTFEFKFSGSDRNPYAFAIVVIGAAALLSAVFFFCPTRRTAAVTVLPLLLLSALFGILLIYIMKARSGNASYSENTYFKTILAAHFFSGSTETWFTVCEILGGLFCISPVFYLLATALDTESSAPAALYMISALPYPVFRLVQLIKGYAEAANQSMSSSTSSSVLAVIFLVAAVLLIAAGYVNAAFMRRRRYRY